MNVLVIDNYDSFTYNLVHLLEMAGADNITVWKNDQIVNSGIKGFDKILLSPGPGLPFESGAMPELISTFAKSKPMIGICLGLQALAEHFQYELGNLPHVWHGMATTVEVNTHDPLFRNCPKNFKVGRYHSWVVKDKHDGEMKVTARDENGLVMAMRHSSLDLCGVQFHPESILSEHGFTIMSNWLRN
jgi:anthranilate synthase component 2